MDKSNSEEKIEDGQMMIAAGSQENLDRIVRGHVIWAMGAGLIPIPLFDIAAVTAIQMDALSKLAAEEGIDYTSDGGKRFVTALTGGTFARLGASLLKGIPGVGTVIGGLSMSAMSAASTYAICQVAITHFRSEGNFLAVDIDDAKRLYEKALEKGKSFVKSLEREVDPKATQEIYANLEKLKSLRDADVITEAEHDEKKAKLLSKL